MSDIVFVCTGNTCRSPMAAALASALLNKHGLRVSIGCAGVSAMAGQSISRNAKLVLDEFGIDFSEHKAQGIGDKLLKEADLVLAMTVSHLSFVKHVFPNTNAFTLAEYAGEFYDVSDPFGGDINEYRKCAEQINGLLEKSLNRFKEDFL